MVKSSSPQPPRTNRTIPLLAPPASPSALRQLRPLSRPVRKGSTRQFVPASVVAICAGRPLIRDPTTSTEDVMVDAPVVKVVPAMPILWASRGMVLVPIMTEDGVKIAAFPTKVTLWISLPCNRHRGPYRNNCSIDCDTLICRFEPYSPGLLRHSELVPIVGLPTVMPTCWGAMSIRIRRSRGHQRPESNGRLARSRVRCWSQGNAWRAFILESVLTAGFHAGCMVFNLSGKGRSGCNHDLLAFSSAKSATVLLLKGAHGRPAR